MIHKVQKGSTRGIHSPTSSTKTETMLQHSRSTIARTNGTLDNTNDVPSPVLLTIAVLTLVSAIFRLDGEVGSRRVKAAGDAKFREKEEEERRTGAMAIMMTSMDDAVVPT